MYYQPTTGKTFIDHAAVRAGVSALFPEVITDDMLAFAGVFPVTNVQPAIDANQVAEPASIEEVDGVWAQQWTVRPATQEEIDAREPVTPTVAEYTAAIQAVLDATAKTRNYDGILSACTYATSTVDKFRAEGQACVEWRDKVWAFGYDLLGKVDAGQAPAPAIADLVSILPKIEWPT